jgi:acetyl esterase/lipase
MAEHITLWRESMPLPSPHDPEIPWLERHRPPAPNGSAVLICPGGSYSRRSPNEKLSIAAWFTARGVTAFIVEYRVGPHNRYPAPLLDVAEAVRLVRGRAPTWGLDPHRIGIIGFSAGAHAAASACVHIDPPELTPHTAWPRLSSRPDFMILLYPVITMDGRFTHEGSRRYLLGDSPDAELMHRTSCDRHVSPRTPPGLLIHAADDTAVPCENSLLMTMAMRRHGVPLELHLYEYGGHGFAMRSDNPLTRIWPEPMEAWLRGRGIV